MVSNLTKQVLFKTLFLESLTVTLAIATALALGESPAFNFREEGFITYVSCLQLLIAFAVSGQVFQLVRSSKSPKLAKNSLFWLIVTLGLLFLALDDAFEIHEQIDLWLHDLLNIQETDLTDLADDMIVGGYLLIFLAYVAWQWKTIKIFQSSFIFFKIGFILTGIMVVFDILSNNTYFTTAIIDDADQAEEIRKWVSALEDSAKIFAEGMFIVGIYQCGQIAKSFKKVDH